MQTATQDDLRLMLSRVCESRGGRAEFARKAGTHPSIITDVLAERRPVPDVIANALGYVRPTYFISVKD